MTFGRRDARRQRGQAAPLPTLTDADLARLRRYKAQYVAECLFGTHMIVTPQLVDRLAFAKWLRERGGLES